MDADGYYTVVDEPTSYKIEIRDENGNLIDGSDSWGLKDACDAVQTARVDGRTIRVTQDLGDVANISGYDFGCSVTIDLSGHAFRNTSSTDAYMFTPGTAGKTLAIVNGHVTFFNDTCNGLALVSAGTFVASNVTCTAGAQTSGKAPVQGFEQIMDDWIYTKQDWILEATGAMPERGYKIPGETYEEMHKRIEEERSQHRNVRQFVRDRERFGHLLAAEKGTTK